MRNVALKLLTGLSAVFFIALAAPALASAATSGGANSVWCASAGNCTAIGNYTQADGAQQGLLLSEVKGVWQPDQLVALPAGANASPAAVLNDLWCTKGPDCVAVGDYTDGSSNQQATVVTESNGAWSTATKITLPAGAIAGGNQFAELNALWCSNAANCVAVGDYTDNQGNQQGMTVTESSGRWGQASATPVPGGAASDPGVALTAIDCTAISACDVMGIYDDQEGNQEGEILVGSAPNWGNGEAGLPTDAAQAAQSVQINALACGASSNCVGVGAFVDDSGNQQPLIIFANGSSFSTLEPTLPANADTVGNPNAQLTSVWCADGGDCTVVGDYSDANGNQQGLMLTESAGSFGQGVELTLPGDADQGDVTTNPNVTLNSVWCASAGSCVAAGGYGNVTQAQVPLIAYESGTSWTTGSSLSLPSGAAIEGNQSATLSSIWCGSIGACSAVGSFTSLSGNLQPLLSSSARGIFATGVVPTAPPTTAQLRTSLTAALGVTKTTVAKVSRSGLRIRYTATEPGKVAVKWLRLGSVVASTPTVTIPKAETVTLTLKLTAAGKRAATKAPTGWAVTAQGQFTPVAPTGSNPITVTHLFKLP